MDGLLVAASTGLRSTLPPMGDWFHWMDLD
jgi:hypothetical protein